MISCDFVGFRDFLGELGCYFLRCCGFPGFPGRTWVLFSALLWGFRDFLGEPGWKQLGMGLGELQELVRGKVAGGWPAILTRNF